MNHYINMLDPAECVIVGGAEASPLIKVGAIGLITLILGYGILTFQTAQSVISEGEDLEKWLKNNAEKVEEAGARFATHQRVERAGQTLSTWKKTRHDYAALLQYIGSRVPDPIDQTQFTNMSFNENIVGLRTRREEPASGQTEHYPLERTVTVRLNGLIQNDRPSLVLDQYKLILQSGDSRPPIDNITLRLQSLRGSKFRNQDGSFPKGITPFEAEFILEDRELKPEKKEASAS